MSDALVDRRPAAQNPDSRNPESHASESFDAFEESPHSASGAPARSERPQREPGIAPDDEPQEQRADEEQTEGRKDKRDDAGVDDEGEAPPPGLHFTKKTALIFGVVAAVILVGGLWYFLATKDIESTDDAQVAGNAVTIGPKVSGQVVMLAVTDNQRVKAGDLLVKIDDRDYVAARDQARAGLMIAQGQLSNAQANLETQKVSAPAKLVLAKATTQGSIASRDIAQSNLARQTNLNDFATTVQNREQALSTAKSSVATVEGNQAQEKIAGLIEEQIAQAQAQVDGAKGQVDQAKAQLETAELNLSYTEVRAPQDGWVTRRSVQVGTYATVGQPFFSIVAPEVWITANFKENQLDRMRPGQRVVVRIDAYKGMRLEGHVDSLQMGTGSVFSAFPAENATGNFVKIVQRVPVKIVIDGGLDPNLPLALGLSVVPTVHFP